MLIVNDGSGSDVLTAYALKEFPEPEWNCMM